MTTAMTETMDIKNLKYYNVIDDQLSISFKKKSSSSLYKKCTSLTVVGDSVLVTKKSGELLLTTHSLTKPSVLLNVVDIDKKFSTEHNEEGLLCAASRDDEIFISYTRSSKSSKGTELVIADVGTIDHIGLVREIIAIPFKEKFHHGGTIRFFSGKMYLGTGDSGPQGDPNMHSQDLSTLWGKMIEIDIDSKSKKNDIGVPISFIAIGLRNPWKFSIETFNGRPTMFIGDVGYDTVEKVVTIDLSEDRVSNFGWSYFEGSLRFKKGLPFDSFNPPIFEYPTKYNGPKAPSAIIGGYMIDEDEYLFGDFGGHVRVIRYSKGTKGALYKSASRWVQVAIAKLDDSIYSIDRVGDEYVALCDGGIYEIIVE